eukprot:TRINITY_DN29114_c0_g2_i1.p1 TRINITY_DN29114_c0_g2~~TRINITY_DN29114_c0_g2_i1.p1  ORF type:complete len:193 (+),score=23.88 TRINITY_DN29114_c0_g2_i1:351-929(+)
MLHQVINLPGKTKKPTEPDMARIPLTIDNVLCLRGGSPWSRQEGCQSLSEAQLKILTDGGASVRWGYLPIRKFLHYTPPPMMIAHGGEGVEIVRLPGRINIEPNDPQLVLVHLWRTAGSPDARAVLACLMGFWQWMYPPSITLPLRGCDWCDTQWPATLRALVGGEHYAWCNSGPDGDPAPGSGQGRVYLWQ